MIQILLIALLMVQAPAMSITAVPAAAEVNQVVTIVAVGAVPHRSIWSLSGGEWCLFVACFWRAADNLAVSPGQNQLWMASVAGTYTITLTTPEGSAATVTIEVAAP